MQISHVVERVRLVMTVADFRGASDEVSWFYNGHRDHKEVKEQWRWLIEQAGLDGHRG